MRKGFMEKEELGWGLSRIYFLREQQVQSDSDKSALLALGEGKGTNPIREGGWGPMVNEVGVIFKYLFEIMFQVF